MLTFEVHTFGSFTWSRTSRGFEQLECYTVSIQDIVARVVLTTPCHCFSLCDSAICQYFKKLPAKVLLPLAPLAQMQHAVYSALNLE